MRLLFALVVGSAVGAAAFQPADRTELKIQVDTCGSAWDTGVCADVANWDVSLVTDMLSMFYFNSAFNEDISAWDVSQVTTMVRMFHRAPAFDKDLSAWNVSRVTTMGSMFESADAFNQDLSAWDVSQVTNMARMFTSADAFNKDLSAWDVSQVTTMESMFGSASAFNQDLSAWDVSNLVGGWHAGGSAKMMFTGATNFNQYLCGQSWANSYVPGNDLTWHKKRWGTFENSGGGFADAGCTLCPAGKKSTGEPSSAGQQTCTACDAGTHSARDGQTICLQSLTEWTPAQLKQAYRHLNGCGGDPVVAPAVYTDWQGDKPTLAEIQAAFDTARPCD